MHLRLRESSVYILYAPIQPLRDSRIVIWSIDVALLPLRLAALRDLLFKNFDESGQDYRSVDRYLERMINA